MVKKGLVDVLQTKELLEVLGKKVLFDALGMKGLFDALEEIELPDVAFDVQELQLLKQKEI